MADARDLKLLIVEARFYDHLADALLEGAKAALDEAGASYDVVTVPGALEIPAAILDLSMEESIAVGNGILTTENEQQALIRARRREGDKGGFAARAALAMIALRERLGA
jgi:6,7-dimethyl-8-ribityllumazine synthase